MNKKIKKMTSILALTVIMNTQSIYALNLIDNADEIYKEIEKSETATIGNAFELRFGTDIKNEYQITNYKGYVLNEENKYLIGKDVLHEFDKDNKYIKSIQFEELEGAISMKFKNVKSMNQELNEYKKAGFSTIPNIHFSLITKDTKYFNQLNNRISPDTTCVPTAFSIYLSMLGVKDITPDDLSKDIPNTSNGMYTDVPADVLNEQGVYAVSKTYHFLPTITAEIDKNPIVRILNKGTPIQTTLNASKLDYIGRNSVANDRFYHLKGYEVSDIFHSAIITGYVIIDDTLYLEFLDPWSAGYSYNLSKSIPDGKGKYMKYEDFEKAFYYELVSYELDEPEPTVETTNINE